MAERALLFEDVPVDGSSPEGGAISVWTLNRPDKLNALNTQSHQDIKEQCARVESDDNVRCIVIRGSPPLETEEGKRPKPPAFAAGADISEFAGKDSDDVRPFFDDNAWEAVWNLSKPTIAMVDGFALGGGTELALSCDIRIASDRSTFGQPEINLGLIPGGGGTQRLCRLIGYGRTMEIVLSGGMVSAEAEIDFSSFDENSRQGGLELLSYLNGQVPVRFNGSIFGRDGVGTVTVDAFTVAGLPLPPSVFRQLLRSYAATEDFLEDIDVLESFDLPYGIAELRVEHGRIEIVQ